MAADPIRVLIVDDNAAAARLLANQLSEHGLEARAATEAEEAVAIALAFAPTVVVLDLFLRGTSGLDLARALRADPQAGYTAIIVLSGHSGDEYRERARNAGCDFYLVKPCPAEELVKAIREVLARGSRKSPDSPSQDVLAK